MPGVDDGNEEDFRHGRHAEVGGTAVSVLYARGFACAKVVRVASSSISALEGRLAGGLFKHVYSIILLESHTQLAKMNFDEIVDFTAVVSLYIFVI